MLQYVEETRFCEERSPGLLNLTQNQLELNALFLGAGSISNIYPTAYLFEDRDRTDVLYLPQRDENLGIRIIPYKLGQCEAVGYIPAFTVGSIYPPLGYYIDRNEMGEPIVDKNLLPIKKLETEVNSNGIVIYEALEHSVKYTGWDENALIDASRIRSDVKWGNDELRQMYDRSLVKLGVFVGFDSLLDRRDASRVVLNIIADYRNWQDSWMQKSEINFVPGEAYGISYDSEYQYLDWCARNRGRINCTQNMSANILADYMQSLGIRCQVARFNKNVVDDHAVAWKSQESQMSEDKVIVYLPDGRVVFIDPFSQKPVISAAERGHLQLLKDGFATKHCEESNIKIKDVDIWANIVALSKLGEDQKSEADRIYGLSRFMNLSGQFRSIYTAFAGFALNKTVTIFDFDVLTDKFKDLPALPLFFDYTREHQTLDNLVQDLAAKWFANGQSGVKLYGVRDLFDEVSRSRVGSFLSHFSYYPRIEDAIRVNPLTKKPFRFARYSAVRTCELNERVTSFLPKELIRYYELVRLHLANVKALFSEEKLVHKEDACADASRAKILQLEEIIQDKTKNVH